MTLTSRSLAYVATAFVGLAGGAAVAAFTTLGPAGAAPVSATPAATVTVTAAADDHGGRGVDDPTPSAAPTASSPSSVGTTASASPSATASASGSPSASGVDDHGRRHGGHGADDGATEAGDDHSGRGSGSDDGNRGRGSDDSGHGGSGRG